MLSQLKRTRYVYHYTSIETLFAILGNYRNTGEKDQLVFRASNIFRVNDPSEMVSGYDIVKSYLYNYEIEKNIPEELRLSEVYINIENENKCKDDYLNTIRGNYIDIGSVPYVISFSGKRDYLPMWSMYGNQGKGVCLKFDVYDIINNMIFPLITGFVSYDKKTCYKKLSSIISFLYDGYLDSWKEKEEKLTIENKIYELSFICFSVSPFIKYKDYKYEKEYRMVHNMHYGPDVNLLSKRLLISLPVQDIKPYVEIPIYAYSLKEIIMGPCIDKQIMKDVVKREIDSCKLSVRVSYSEVPFRIK